MDAIKSWTSTIWERVVTRLGESFSRLYHENPRFIMIVVGCAIAYMVTTFVKDQQRVQEANDGGGFWASAILWMLAAGVGFGIWMAVNYFVIGKSTSNIERLQQEADEAAESGTTTLMGMDKQQERARQAESTGK